MLPRASPCPAEGTRISIALALFSGCRCVPCSAVRALLLSIDRFLLPPAFWRELCPSRLEPYSIHQGEGFFRHHLRAPLGAAALAVV